MHSSVQLFTGGRLQVGSAGKVFDAEGNLVDETVRRQLETYLAGFAQFVARHGNARD